MPQGTKIISAGSWGISAWTKTAKIEVSLAEGTSKRYFLKVRPTSSINSMGPSEIGWEHSARQVGELFHYAKGSFIPRSPLMR